MSKDNKDFFKEKKVWSVVKDELLGCYLVPYFSKLLSIGVPLGGSGKHAFASTILPLA